MPSFVSNRDAIVASLKVNPATNIPEERRKFLTEHGNYKLIDDKIAAMGEVFIKLSSAKNTAGESQVVRIGAEMSAYNWIYGTVDGFPHGPWTARTPSSASNGTKPASSEPPAVPKFTPMRPTATQTSSSPLPTPANSTTQDTASPSHTIYFTKMPLMLERARGNGPLLNTIWNEHQEKMMFLYDSKSYQTLPEIEYQAERAVWVAHFGEPFPTWEQTTHTVASRYLADQNYMATMWVLEEMVKSGGFLSPDNGASLSRAESPLPNRPQKRRRTENDN